MLIINAIQVLLSLFDTRFPKRSSYLHYIPLGKNITMLADFSNLAVAQNCLPQKSKGLFLCRFSPLGLTSNSPTSVRLRTGWRCSRNSKITQTVPLCQLHRPSGTDRLVHNLKHSTAPCLMTLLLMLIWCKVLKAFQTWKTWTNLFLLRILCLLPTRRHVSLPQVWMTNHPKQRDQLLSTCSNTVNKFDTNDLAWKATPHKYNITIKNSVTF